MAQNTDQERQQINAEFEKLVQAYYVRVGQLNSLFEDFKNSALGILNQTILENQSLKAHLKALQDEKDKANINIKPEPKKD